MPTICPRALIPPGRVSVTPGNGTDFVQTRRPARSRKKLENRSPHAVLCWLKRLIPFIGQAEPRAIAPEKGLSRCGPGHYGQVRAVNAGPYLRRHAPLFPAKSGSTRMCHPPGWVDKALSRRRRTRRSHPAWDATARRSRCIHRNTGRRRLALSRWLDDRNADR